MLPPIPFSPHSLVDCCLCVMLFHTIQPAATPYALLAAAAALWAAGAHSVASWLQATCKEAPNGGTGFEGRSVSGLGLTGDKAPVLLFRCACVFVCFFLASAASSLGWGSGARTRLMYWPLAYGTCVAALVLVARCAHAIHRGLRVRFGMHSGLAHSSEMTFNRAAGRVQYSVGAAPQCLAPTGFYGFSCCAEVL